MLTDLAQKWALFSFRLEDITDISIDILSCDLQVIPPSDGRPSRMLQRVVETPSLRNFLLSPPSERRPIEDISSLRGPMEDRGGSFWWWPV